MKLIGKVLAHFAVVLNVCLLIVVYLDLRNPMMGFLSGAPFLTLVFCAGVCSVTSAVILLVRYRTEERKCTNPEYLQD